MPAQPAVPLLQVSVVVPTFRSPGTLAELCDELAVHVKPLCADFEVLIVDDGNVDDTWQVITELSERLSWVRGVQLLRNYGQHNALLAGFRLVRHPIVLTLDDDLQNPPSEAPRLLEQLDDDVDLVYGTPVEQPQSIGRNAASIVTKRMMARLLGPDVFPKSSAFRLFRRELLVATDLVQDPFVSVDVLLSWTTTRVRSVDVHFARRKEGASNYTFGRLVRHAFNMITGYSTRPLRIVSALGLLFAVFGFALLGFVLLRYSSSEGVPGFTFLAAAVTMFSGVQLVSLGVVGEYLARMHFRSMGRPAFAIRRTTTDATASTDQRDNADR